MLCYFHVKLGGHHFFGGNALVWRQIASVVIVRTQKIFSGLLLPAVEQHRAVHWNEKWHQLK